MVTGSVEDRQCRACSAKDKRRGHGRQKEGRLQKEEGGVVGPAELSSHGAFSLLGIVESINRCPM